MPFSARPHVEQMSKFPTADVATQHANTSRSGPPKAVRFDDLAKNHSALRFVGLSEYELNRSMCELIDNAIAIAVHLLYCPRTK